MHDEMVAPLRVSEKSVPRRIASRLTKRPVYSGDPADWKTFSHRARAFFDEVHIEATMLRNDARKTSDDADDVAQWSDDNALGFNLLQGMIDDKTAKGRILLMKIIEEFPGVAERKGDELWKWMEETVTGISMEQVDELKRDIRRVKLLENETADQWEEKIMNLKNMFSRLPERSESKQVREAVRARGAANVAGDTGDTISGSAARALDRSAVDWEGDASGSHAVGGVSRGSVDAVAAASA